MNRKKLVPWNRKIVNPEKVMDSIRPGMNIFLGTGVAEPRTLIQNLMASTMGNLSDLTLIQLISVGEALPIDERYFQKYRLKTFFSGYVANEAITAGRVDLIQSRFSKLPGLIASGAIQVDAAFVQISPPDETGYASLGVSVDVARQAMEKADLVVGEINCETPRTNGDTFVHVDDFNYLVESTEPMIYTDRWSTDDVFDKVAYNVASLLQDGDCIGYSMGPLYEALVPYLSKKRQLGVHSLMITDALMEIIKSGAVSNRRKRVFPGKSVVSYAFGTPELIRWLNDNPLIEFQSIKVVADPRLVGGNKRYMAILPARKIDLSGRVAMHAGKGLMSASQGAAEEMVEGANFSSRGRIIMGLPSRNLRGEPNIRLTVNEFPKQLEVASSIDFVVTEYGVAHLAGRSVRERALALIDIAHPEDRAMLINQAKEACLIYRDQIYLESGHYYPEELSSIHTFKDGLNVRFRAIRPSDEEEMRRLFYRFSSESVYYRYFSPIKAMPHTRMQKYVNVDYSQNISIVGLVGEPGGGRLIAEARYAAMQDRPYADTAFVVDEDYQGKGIATYLLNILIRLAKERGLQGISADVLANNIAMWKVYQKAPYPLRSVSKTDYHHLTITFDEDSNIPMHPARADQAPSS
ncbi:MAG: GNAT family N-acetyltransferase [Desulfobacterales bacterium]|nr:GNAT family N-acetyltransferase [Desulfobacterales bacterium]MDX2511234.1 GNAT family N-acetyltransferase [Desulfobacterales bacterium]